MDALFSLHSVPHPALHMDTLLVPLGLQLPTLDYPSVKNPSCPVCALNSHTRHVFILAALLILLWLWYPILGLFHPWVISSPCLNFDSLFQAGALCHCPLYLYQVLASHPWSVPTLLTLIGSDIVYWAALLCGCPDSVCRATAHFCVDALHPGKPLTFPPTPPQHTQLSSSPWVLISLFRLLTYRCLFWFILPLNTSPPVALGLNYLWREEPPTVFNSHPSCLKLIYLPSLMTPPPIFVPVFSLQPGHCVHLDSDSASTKSPILILSKCWYLSLSFIYINGNESVFKENILHSPQSSILLLTCFTISSPCQGLVRQLGLQLELLSVQFSLVFETLGVIVEMVASLRQQEDWTRGKLSLHTEG